LVCPSEKAVESSEVRLALTELCSVSACRPHVRSLSEGDDSSDDISDGSSADALISGPEAEFVDELGDVVFNLLNNSAVGPAVMQALQRDPAFRNMVDRYTPRMLSSSHALLALPAPYSSTATAQSTADGNPIDSFFKAIALALDKFGEAVCAFGSIVRHLPDDLRIVL